MLQGGIDPNEFIDPTGIGWEELAAAALAMGAAVLLAVVVRRFVVRWVMRFPNVNSGLARFVGRLAGWLVVVAGAVIALMNLGVQAAPVFLLIVIVGGVLFLSARPVLENLGAGVVLQAESPFKVGDLVQVAGAEGMVHEISGRTTVIDTYDGRRAYIPNIEVLANPIVNQSARRGLRSELMVGVEYGTDLDRAQVVIAEAAAEIEGVRNDPTPLALVKEFDDSSVNYRVLYWHDPAVLARYSATDEVARAIHRALRREGISIAFPHRVVFVRDRGGA